MRLEYTPKVRLQFDIAGSQRRVYKVAYPVSGPPTCSCPDATIRGACCKHILFVGLKILNIPPSRWPSGKPLPEIHGDILRKLPHLDVLAPDELNNRYRTYLKKETSTTSDTPLPRNLECCICLCEFDTDKSTTDRGGAEDGLVTCQRCNNAVHTECWSKWETVNRTNCCVYCRQARGMSTGMTQTGNRDEYGVQL